MKATLLVLGCLGALAFVCYQALATVLHPLIVALGGVR